MRGGGRIGRALGFGVFAWAVIPAATLPSAFSGAYGGTVGAGAALGWERQSLEGNPAAFRARNLGVSVAGYSPFALDAVSVFEAGISLDGPRCGAALMYRGTTVDGGGSTSTWQGSEVADLGLGFTAGLSQRVQSDGGWNNEVAGFGGAAGLRWSRNSFFTVGLMSEGMVSALAGDIATAAGFDFGDTIPGSSMAWRACVEGWLNSESQLQWRFGAAWQLHSALSLYTGWSPALETMALGVRFGMGHWEGFHALRRHAVLGTTSLQSLHWQRTLGSLNP